MAFSGQFTPVDWCKRATIYEVNVRQYTNEGNFQAFKTHLPRLAAMGVDILWFMPITPIGVPRRKGILGSYYACSSYLRINPEFGSLKDFQELVAEAHSLGMKVIIDWVANHTGYGHDWMASHPDYYLKDAKGNYVEVHGWDDVADLDYNNHKMRQEMVRSMRYWVEECDIDGFRCDMAHLVPLDFWALARTVLDKVKHLFWLAETDNPLYHTVFDASYAWEWMHATEKVIRNNLSVTALDKVLYKYEHDLPDLGWKLFFTTNHDENSWNGTEFEKYGANALPLAVLCATWPGLFLLYSGQEIPNERRLKFFEKDQLAWPETPELETFYRTLLLLRRSNHAAGGLLSEGKTRRIPTGSGHGFAFWRQVQGDELLVVINFGEKAFAFRTDTLRLEGEFSDVFNGEKLDGASGSPLQVGASSYRVLSKKINFRDGGE